MPVAVVKIKKIHHVAMQQAVDHVADGVDFDAVAKKTDHFSGADLKAVVDVAVGVL